MTPSHTAPHGIDISTLDLMIIRIRRSLVEDIHGCTTNLHPLAPEAEIGHPRDFVFVPIDDAPIAVGVSVSVTVTVMGGITSGEIVDEEEGQALHGAEECALHG